MRVTNIILKSGMTVSQFPPYSLVMLKLYNVDLRHNPIELKVETTGQRKAKTRLKIHSKKASGNLEHFNKILDFDTGRNSCILSF